MLGWQSFTKVLKLKFISSYIAIHFLLASSPIDDIFWEEPLKVISEGYGTEFRFFSEFGVGVGGWGKWAVSSGVGGRGVLCWYSWSFFSGSKIQHTDSLGGGGY